MAVIVPAVIVLNDGVLKIGANNYELSVSRTMLTPTTPKQKFKGIGGNTISKIGTPEWVCDIDYPQDWETANSLSKFLMAEAGETVPAEFTPKAGGDAYEFNLVIEPGQMGGTVDELLAGSITLEVDGQPTLVTP